MSALGLYFGPKVISAVETKDKTISNNIQILQSAISSGELEDKIPSEVKLVTLLKSELLKNKIDTKDVTLTLPGKDLIIRTFEMPVIPQNELDNAVRFEAKKYIPFKIEDVISDFQIQYDKISRKNLVLFTGIKKDTLDRYLSIMGQLGIKASAIEYSAFSTLRFLPLANVKDKGVIAVINIDAKEEDEINFMVLENGFPLFSRDISFTEGSAMELSAAKEPDYGMVIEKIKTEIRISLDYYHRKFPAKKIETAFFLSAPECRADIENALKDMGVAVQFIDASKLMGSPLPFSLNITKGYSASISKIVKNSLKINVLTALDKTKQRESNKKSGVASAAASAEPIKIPYSMIALAVLICGGVFAFGMYQMQPVKQEIASIISQRLQVPGVNGDASYEELNALNSSYKVKADSLDSLVKGQVYLTKLLEAIAKVKPEGIWLNGFYFKKGEQGIELNIEAMAYLGDSEKEFELVNKFIEDLKNSPAFAKYFKDINIATLDRSSYKDAEGRKDAEKITVTTFKATCYPVKRGRD